MEIETGISKEEKSVLVEGRERLKGFKVIDATNDGSMSIVEKDRASRANRISVFFKGERMTLKKFGVRTVTAIGDNGYLVLVGDDLYIDDVLEEVERNTAKNNDRTKEADKTEKESDGNNASDREVVIRSSKHEVAEGWKVTGIYGDNFLVESPTGEWMNLSEGDKVDALGLVNGLNKEGNLVIGKFVINMSKND